MTNARSWVPEKSEFLAITRVGSNPCFSIVQAMAVAERHGANTQIVSDELRKLREQHMALAQTTKDTHTLLDEQWKVEFERFM